MSNSIQSLQPSPGHCGSRRGGPAALLVAACLFACGTATAQSSLGASTPDTLLHIPAALLAYQADQPQPEQISANQSETSAKLPSSSTADSLEVSFTPYAWLTSFNGTVGARGIEADINQSFADIFEASESIFGLMGDLEFTYKRFIFQLNGAYSAAEFGGERGRSRTGPLGTQVELDASMDLELTTLWGEALAGYRFYETKYGQNQQNALSMDAFGGVRVTSVGVDQSITTLTTITLPNGTVLESGQTRSLDDTETWFEPFVGLRTGMKLGENWELIFRGDVGGFGVSNSDFSWQLLAGGGYRWYYEGWSLGLFGGYRALSQDYSSGEFVWDVVTHGPVVGLSINFSF